MGALTRSVYKKWLECSLTACSCETKWVAVNSLLISKQSFCFARCDVNRKRLLAISWKITIWNTFADFTMRHSFMKWHTKKTHVVRRNACFLLTYNGMKITKKSIRKMFFFIELNLPNFFGIHLNDATYEKEKKNEEFTCFEFSRICLRAISSSSRWRSTSNGLTIDSDGFVRFSSMKSSYWRKHNADSICGMMM